MTRMTVIRIEKQEDPDGIAPLRDTILNLAWLIGNSIAANLDPIRSYAAPADTCVMRVMRHADYSGSVLREEVSEGGRAVQQPCHAANKLPSLPFGSAAASTRRVSRIGGFSWFFFGSRI